MSQTSVLNLAGSKEVKMSLNSIGTRIPEVCERLECVTDQCIKFGRVQGGKNRFKSIGTRILEVCNRSECAADQCFGWRRVKGS